MHAFKMACCFAALVLIGAHHASGAIIASDDFTYVEGDLDGNSGGTGWSGAWGSGGGSGASSVNIDVNASGEVVANSAGRTSRLLTSPLGADGTTVYIGVDMKFDGTFYRSFEMHNNSAGDGDRQLQIAVENGGGDGGGQGLLVKVGSNIINVNDAFADNTFHRYVIKLTFGTGATDTAEVFVDGVSTGPATNLANDITIDRAGFAAFRSEGTNPASGDTLVIATTFAEAAIPEPGSLALLGLGGLFVLGRRRI